MQRLLMAALLVCCLPLGCAQLPTVSSSSATKVSLENTYWRLQSLGGTTIAAGERLRESHFVLQSRDQRVSGSTGCNRMMGAYTLKDESLRFGNMATTRMACIPGVAHESGFLNALQAVRGWRIEGSRLSLLDQQGQTLAVLEAVAP
jgi:heat shock protein HslJ